MKKFVFKFVDEDNVIEFKSGRSALWKSQDYGATLPDTDSKQGRRDFAWGYYAAKQAGKLEELGIPEDTPIEEAIEFLGDTYDLIISDNKPKEEDDPLASGDGE